MGVVGDFSLMNPYGVRVKGFSCDWLGLRVTWSIGSGLRVCQGSRLGLRVRSPDDHVTLFIPLYLTWGVFAIVFPSSSLPLLTIDLLTTLLLLQLKMTTPFAQYVDGMMDECPILNRPMQLVGFYLMTYLASHTDGTLLELYLQHHWTWLLPPWWEGWWNQSRSWQSSTSGYWLGGKVSKVGCFGSHLRSLY